MERKIVGLAICWALTLSTTIILTDIGPLSALRIGVSESFASLTITFYFVGATVSSICSIMLFQHVGRYWGFTLGCLFQLVGCGCGIVGMLINQPIYLFLGCFSVGFSQVSFVVISVIVSTYRFAALDADKSSGNGGVSVTTVLSGGLLAAICGPSLASSSRTLFGLDFVGSYLMIGVLSLANQSLLSFISFDIGSHSETKVLLQQDEELSRPLVTIFRDPLFLLACGTATLSNTTMVMVMSQFSLEMDKLNYQFAHISLVLEFHLFAMYSPSLFTGHLFNYLSPPTLSILGNLLCIVGIGVMSSTNEYFGYLLGMIIIGISWNIAYSSSTLMLAGCYNVSEAYLVQGVNDTLLMVVSGLGTLISGVIFAHFGWYPLLFSVGVLTLLSVALIITLQYGSNNAPMATTQDEQVCQYGAMSVSPSRL